MRYVLDVCKADGSTTVVYIGDVVQIFYNESDESDEILVARLNESARKECLFANGKWMSEPRLLDGIQGGATHIQWRELFVVRD